MTQGAANRGQQRFQNDIRMRVDVIDQRGVAISDPISRFTAVTGPAGRGAAASFTIQGTQGIARIEVLRSIYRDSASAQIIASYPVNEIAIGQPTGIEDAASFATGTPLCYWVRAIPIQAKFQPILHGPFTVTVA